MLHANELKDLQLKSAEIVKNVGKYIAENFDLVNNISYKDSRDFFTDIDLEAENRLKNQLHKLFPQAGFILEEGKNKLSSTYNWTIDPIDQTKNYATKLPIFYTQISLLENMEPVLGHIYQPLSNQLFSASKDNGATLNAIKLFCDEKRNLQNSIVDLDIASNTSISFRIKLISELIPRVYRLRNTPAFAIYITTGAIDGFIGIYKGDKYVDLAPRIIIIKESGFNTEIFEIGELKFYIASNKNIFPLLKNVLEECKEYLVK